MFKWDGTFLGTFEKTIIVDSPSVYHGIRYVAIQLDPEKKIKNYCFIRTYSKDECILCCLFDEIKELFGVTKTGTHYIIIGKRYHVLYYMNKSSGLNVIDNDISPELLTKNDFIEDNIRKLICMRDLLGVNPNAISTIKLRQTVSGFYYPISIFDKFKLKGGMSTEGKIKVSEATLNRWFRECTIKDITRSMINLSLHSELSYLEISTVVNKKRTELDTLIKSEYKDFIWLVNHIIQRLMARLLDQDQGNGLN